MIDFQGATISSDITQLRIYETKGVVSSNYTKMIRFKEQLCYRAFKKMIGTASGELLRMSSLDEKFQNQFSRAAAKSQINGG